MSQSVGSYTNLIRKSTVLAGNPALYRAGLINYTPVRISGYTQKKELDGVQLGPMRFVYTESIDYTNNVVPCNTNPNILIPLPERAIAEYIYHERFCEEGLLIEALQDYLWRVEKGTGSIEKLIEIGEMYGVKEETMRYWIKEAEEDYEV